MIKKLKNTNEKPLLLLVDDLPDNLKVLGNILMEMKYRIIFANNGLKAIEMAKSSKPDLILLDIQMPDMDGYDVCRILKSESQTADIPVIFLTANSDIDEIVKGFDVGGLDYITKPYQKKELLSRIKTHLELKKAKEELMLLNATKDKFFSIIAHDLKNPFNALLFFSESMSKKVEKQDYDSVVMYSKMIYESSKQGFELLQNLLQWSQTQTGRIKYKPEKKHINEIVRQSIDSVKAQAHMKEIEISCHIDQSVELNIDENILKTVIRNLLSNAIKYTPHGGTVTIRLEASNSYYTLFVSDTGIGIEPEKLGSLFRIDKVISTPGTNAETGTGLGLILCKELVEIMGGTINVTSLLGKGTEFSLTIPK